MPVSAVGLAVQQVANDRKKLFITHSTGTADFHGKFCSPYTMQWVFDTHALAVGTAQEVVKRGGDSIAHNGHLREDGLMVHDLMLVQVKKPEESKHPWDYYQILTRIPGEQAFGPPNPACPLVKG